VLRDNSGVYSITLSSEAHPGNWLPVDSDYRFQLALRAYRPDYKTDEVVADQEVTQQAGQRTFSPTGTALEAIQATPIALTTLQPTFGVPRVGMTATAATQQEDAADEDTAELAASAVEATATALIESSTAADDGAAAEEGQALGGMAGGAAPEDTDDAASASEEEQAAGSSLMMEQAEAEEAAESTPMPDEASAAPSTQLPEPETLLQTLLRWLIFFLQNLGS